MSHATDTDSGYQEKGDAYFSGVRKEIIPLLSEKNDTILEVGCGAGSTLSYLKGKGLCQTTVGIELFSEAAEIAKEHLDEAYQGNIESMELPFSHGRQFDTILCLDVLEHLIDPWAVIRKLDPLLKPGGALIVSLPNIRYYKVSFDLVFKGRWEYQDEGIMDRTHLRFFTYNTALELVENSGLKVDQVIYKGLEKGTSHYRSNLLSLGKLTHLLTEQYLIRATKSL